MPEIKIVPNSINPAYVFSKGYFGVKVKNLCNWYSCREYFHSYADCVNLNGYFYCIGTLSVENFISFVELLEDHFKIENRTVIQHTDKPNVVWLNLSNWWVKNPMNHAFFTIAIRSVLGFSNKIKKDDLKKTIMTHEYFTTTQKAVEEFFKGKTEYVGNTREWVRSFYNTTNEMLLQVPKKESAEDKIRKVAHMKWQKEGNPVGKDVDFWLEAEKEYGRWGDVLLKGF